MAKKKKAEEGAEEGAKKKKPIVRYSVQKDFTDFHVAESKARAELKEWAVKVIEVAIKVMPVQEIDYRFQQETSLH